VDADEPLFTRRKVKEFLSHHSAYELIPESGKVVLLDVDLPLRQAFHALYEQGIASAPLFDGEAASVCGIASASDFITTLQRLRSLVSSSSNPMSEAEMDQHTIRGLREELAMEGRPPKQLVYVTPGDTLSAVVRTLFDNHCSMAPILHPGPERVESEKDSETEVLHLATLSGVLACLMRHFRASLASLPLLAQPLHSLPVGTWSPDSSALESEASSAGATERRDRKRVAHIQTISPTAPLTEALGLLLEGGISCLPVVDESGALVDIYARSDITMLVKANAYSRLQFEDVTVGQALALAAQPSTPAVLVAPPHSPQWAGGVSPSSSAVSMQDHAISTVHNKQRVHVCTPHDALRSVVERLSVPGVRRLVVIDPETRHVEGIVSLSDVAAFMLL